MERTITLTYEQIKIIDTALFDRWLKLDAKKDEKAKAVEEVFDIIDEIRHKMRLEEKAKSNK